MIKFEQLLAQYNDKFEKMLEKRFSDLSRAYRERKTAGQAGVGGENFGRTAIPLENPDGIQELAGSHKLPSHKAKQTLTPLSSSAKPSPAWLSFFSSKPPVLTEQAGESLHSKKSRGPKPGPE